MIMSSVTPGIRDEFCYSIDKLQRLELDEGLTGMSWFGKAVVDPWAIFAEVLASKGWSSSVAYQTF